MSPAEIDFGLAYSAAMGAVTIRAAFELAISRKMFSDAELESGKRFTHEAIDPILDEG